MIFTKRAENADCRLAFYRMFGSLTYAQFGWDGKSCETNIAPGAKNCGSQCDEIVCRTNMFVEGIINMLSY